MFPWHQNKCCLTDFWRLKNSFKIDSSESKSTSNGCYMWHGKILPKYINLPVNTNDVFALFFQHTSLLSTHDVFLVWTRRGLFTFSVFMLKDFKLFIPARISPDLPWPWSLSLFPVASSKWGGLFSPSFCIIFDFGVLPRDSFARVNIKI